MPGITPQGYALFACGRDARQDPWPYDPEAKCDVCEKAKPMFYATMPKENQEMVRHALLRICKECLFRMAEDVRPTQIAYSLYTPD